MALFESEALILRTYNLAEADKIVVCLTRGFGLIRGVAKGARKLKNRFGAALEPFTLVKLTYYHNETRELVNLRQAEILRSYFKLSSDATVLTGLSYMGDLLVDFSPPHQSNDLLFRMVTACLEALAPSDLQGVLRYFEIWLLKIEGFLPDLHCCADCQRPLANENIILGPDFVLRCRKCAPAGTRLMSKPLHAQLRATEKLSPAKFAEQWRDVTAPTSRELAELTHQLIGRVLERLPRVRPVFIQ
ncbi:MAG: DNA repair protein RecO [Pyrinomonadaceae bacterium]